MLRKIQAVLGARINALSWDAAMTQIMEWSQIRDSRYVCICNVHSVVTTTLDPAFKSVINNADMATPDGAPIAWVLRKLGFSSQERISGPDLMWRYLQIAEQRAQPVYFYGSTDATLDKLMRVLAVRFPKLRVAGTCAPPFRSLDADEDAAVVDRINRSGAHVVFVGLGCPKQEKWMAAHCGRINAVMIGVGAAFDFHSGTVKRAPLWWQQHGLEWLYRLCAEPRRLLKRYAVSNTLFVLGIARQLLVKKMAGKLNQL